MLKPEMIEPPSLMLTGAGDGCFRFPLGTDVSSLVKRRKIRLFSKSIAYYEDPITKAKYYPDWYIRKQKV